MSMNNLMKSKSRIKDINNKHSDNLVRVMTPKKATFDEKYKRVTTYLEFGLYNLIEEHRNNGLIPKKTDFFNDAIREYLENHFE